MATRTQSATLVLRVHHALTDTFGLVKLFLSRVADSHKGVMPAHLVVQQSSDHHRWRGGAGARSSKQQQSQQQRNGNKTRFKNPLAQFNANANNSTTAVRQSRQSAERDLYHPVTQGDFTSASAASCTSSAPVRRKLADGHGSSTTTRVEPGKSVPDPGRTDSPAGGGGCMGGVVQTRTGFNISGDGNGDFSYTNTNNHSNNRPVGQSSPQTGLFRRRSPLDFPALNLNFNFNLNLNHLKPSTWSLLHLRQPNSAFTRNPLQGRTHCSFAAPTTVHEMSIRRAARRLNVTFNDLLLASVSGGCRMYLCSHGDDAATLRGLRVAMPLPLHYGRSNSCIGNSPHSGGGGRGSGRRRDGTRAGSGGGGTGGDTAGECFTTSASASASGTATTLVGAGIGGGAGAGFFFYDPHQQEVRAEAAHIPLCVDVADRMTRLKRCTAARRSARSKRYGHGKKALVTAKLKLGGGGGSGGGRHSKNINCRGRQSTHDGDVDNDDHHHHHSHQQQDDQHHHHKSGTNNRKHHHNSCDNVNSSSSRHSSERRSSLGGGGSGGASILFSNVAGPLDEMCIGYVDVSEMFLVPPAGTQVPVSVGAITYNGTLFLTVCGDVARLSDPQELMDAIVNEIHALTALSYSSKVSRKA